MLEVKCLTSIESLIGISKQWELLLKQSLHNNYSLSWSWTSHWINIFLDRDDQLLCLAVYDNQKLVGIGPFWVATKRQGLFGKIKKLQFLGSREVCSDHLDLIIHHKNSEKICTAIWNQLFGPLKKKWDIWEYSNVSVGSKILQFLRKLSDDDRRCLGLRINEYEVCPYIKLPSTWENYIGFLSVNQRRSLKVSSCLLSGMGDVALKFCENVQEFSSFMDTHINLHRKSWNDRGMFGSFGTEKFCRFHNQFAREQLYNGNLFLCNLELSNVPVGSFYGFVYNNVLHYYLIGVNRQAVPKANIGRVLLARCIEEAIRRGYVMFDFLRGSENYKYDWTDFEQRELLVTFYNRSFCSLLFIFTQFLNSFIRQVGHVLLGNKICTFKQWLKKIAK